MIMMRRGKILRIPEGHLPTIGMMTGTVIKFDGGYACKVRSSHYDPLPWVSMDRIGRSDEWAQQQIDKGATITYPEC
jgi:hypothetical protein